MYLAVLYIHRYRQHNDIVGVLCVTYKTGSALDDWNYSHLIPCTLNYRQLQRYRFLKNYRSLLHTIVSLVCYTLHQSFPGNSL
jgi:hypothetical protein